MSEKPKTRKRNFDEATHDRSQSRVIAAPTPELGLAELRTRPDVARLPNLWDPAHEKKNTLIVYRNDHQS